MAACSGVPLRRLLLSAERFSDVAIRFGSCESKMLFSRSRASLVSVTFADHFRPGFPLAILASVLRSFLRNSDAACLFRQSPGGCRIAGWDQSRRPGRSHLISRANAPASKLMQTELTLTLVAGPG